MTEKVKEIEKLQEDEKQPEEVVIETTEDDKEEEVKAEEPKTEEEPKTVEDKKEDEVDKDDKKEEPVEEKAEDIKEEIETTKEELAVIKEVRDELVDLYAKYSETEKNREQLAKDNKILSENVEKLELKLNIYKEAEEKLALKQKQERLEKLSAKFSALGQEKSVEQLSAKDDETLEEFEKIVDAALDKSNDVKEMPSVTAPSQGESLSESESDEEKPSEEEPKAKESVKEEKLSNNKGLFKNICATLTKEQMSSSGKRTKYM